MEPVILIDVMNLAFRSHHAFPALSSDGRPTGVVYGFLRTVLELRERVSKRMIFAWDHGVPVPGTPRPANWRDKFLSGYKASRKRDDESRKLVFSQLADADRIVRTIGYSSVGVPGLEADDLIGLLSREIPGEVLIFSTDKDFYQLLNRRTRVLAPSRDDRKNPFRVVSADDVLAAHGISVDRWPEYLALGGDGSDDIKPARGMGPKTAVKLIKSGVDLGRPFVAQPAAFREKYGEIW